MTSRVIFIQGGGKGAHAEDALLAHSLEQALGSGHELRFPRMPDEAEPDVDSWKKAIAAELSRTPGEALLVAHSIGGSIVLRYLTEDHVEARIAGLYLLAAPSKDDDKWDFEDLELRRDAAGKLAAIPRVIFYHCRDDEVVPFAHLARHAARIPQAQVRAIDHGGHQFVDAITQVAVDIRGAATE